MKRALSVSCYFWSTTNKTNILVSMFRDWQHADHAAGTCEDFREPVVYLAVRESKVSLNLCMRSKVSCLFSKYAPLVRWADYLVSNTCFVPPGQFVFQQKSSWLLLTFTGSPQTSVPETTLPTSQSNASSVSMPWPKSAPPFTTKWALNTIQSVYSTSPKSLFTLRFTPEHIYELHGRMEKSCSTVWSYPLQLWRPEFVVDIAVQLVRTQVARDGLDRQRGESLLCTINNQG